MNLQTMPLLTDRQLAKLPKAIRAREAMLAQMKAQALGALESERQATARKWREERATREEARRETARRERERAVVIAGERAEAVLASLTPDPNGMEHYAVLQAEVRRLDREGWGYAGR